MKGNEFLLQEDAFYSKFNLLGELEDFFASKQASDLIDETIKTLFESMKTDMEQLSQESQSEAFSAYQMVSSNAEAIRVDIELSFKGKLFKTLNFVYRCFRQRTEIMMILLKNSIMPENKEIMDELSKVCLEYVTNARAAWISYLE